MGPRFSTLRRLAAPMGAFAFALAFASGGTPARAAGTAAGTPITNTATASYSDGTTTYNSQSNQVTTYVQNVASENVTWVSSAILKYDGTTITSNTTANALAAPPNAVVSDTFSLSNSGNAPGQFSLNGYTTGSGNTTPATAAGFGSDGSVTPGTTSGSPNAGTDANANMTQITGDATVNYTLLKTVGGTQSSVGTYTTYKALAAAVIALTVQSGDSLQIVTTYNTGAAAAGLTSTGQTVISGISATITSVSAGQATNTPTSTSASATNSDKVVPDARIDISKTQTNTITHNTDPISYQILAANGGNFAPQLQSFTNILGAQGTATAGYAFISDQMPLSGATPLALTAIPTVTVTGGSANYVLYGSTTRNGTGTWTAVTAGNYTTMQIIGVLVTNAAVMAPNNGMTSGYGASGFVGPNPSVTVGQAEVTIALSVGQAGSSSGNPSVSNLANSILVDNANVPQIVGPGASSGYPTSTGNTGNPNSYSAATMLADEYAMMQNATASPAASTQTPAGVSSGYSQIVTTAQLNTALLLGPLNAPAALGSFNPTATSTGYQDASAPSNANDFSASYFYIANAQNDQTQYLTVPSAGTPTSTIQHTIENDGNQSDTVSITTTGCGGSYTIQYVIGGTTYAACSGASPVAVAATVAGSAGRVTYQTVYTPTSTANTFRPFQANAFTETVTSGLNATVSNTTNDILFAGGFVTLTKTPPTFTGTSPNGVACSTFNQASTTTGGAPVGCTIVYSIMYKNLMPNPAQNAGASGDSCAATFTSGGNPCFAASGMSIADDGTLANANWASRTNGIAAAGADTPPAGNSGTFTYYNGPIVSATNGTTYSTQCTVPSPCQALKYVLTNALGPQQTGTISFTAIIK